MAHLIGAGRRRHLGMMGLALVMALATAACGGSGAGTTAASTDGGDDAAATANGDGGGATITFMGPSISGLQTVFDAYEAQNPDITIERIEIPFDDYQATVEQRIGSGSSEVDVFEVDATYIPIWVGRDYLYDLTGDLGDTARDVVRGESLQGATYQDRIWSVPIWDSTQLLFYNRAHLEAADVEPPGQSPDDRWTWDQVTEAARASQQAGARWGLEFEQAERYYQLQVLPESLGGGPGVTGENLLTVDLVNDDWREAMTWFGSLHTDGIAPPQGEFAELQALFNDGELTFFVTGPWNLPGIVAAEEDGLEWGWAPHPYFAGGTPVTPSESWHWGVNPNSDNIPEALDLLEFAGLTTEGNLAAAADQPIPPTNNEAAAAKLAELAGLSQSTAGIDELVLFEMSNSSIQRPRSLGYQSLEELTHRMFGDIRRGSDPGQALQDTQSQLEPVFARIDPSNP